MTINPRIIIYLEDEERIALFTLAGTEKRDARQQAAYLIRAQLKHLGLLQPAPEKTGGKDAD